MPRPPLRRPAAPDAVSARLLELVERHGAALVGLLEADGRPLASLGAQFIRQGGRVRLASHDRVELLALARRVGVDVDGGTLGFFPVLALDLDRSPGQVEACVCWLMSAPAHARGAA